MICVELERSSKYINFKKTRYKIEYIVCHCLYKIKIITHALNIYPDTHTKLVRMVASGRVGGGQTGVGKRHFLLFEYFKIPST